jgi:hypothetical protein
LLNLILKIALLSNHTASRRREDVLAIDYCFVDVFTKYALEDLINEFPRWVIGVFLTFLELDRKL